MNFKLEETNTEDTFEYTREESLKQEDFSSQIVKKEEQSVDPDFEILRTESFGREVNQRFDELLASLEQYLRNFVDVEDFELTSNGLNDDDIKEMISEAKTHFREWGVKIIRLIGEDLKRRAIQHILPDSYLVELVETTKKRIFNSYKQLKRNLAETIETLYGSSNIKEVFAQPQKRIMKKKSDFPRRARTLLKLWFTAHSKDPYPSHEEKINLAREGGISMKQLENWLTNTRGRIWKKMQKQEETKFGLEVQNIFLNHK